MHEVVLLMKQRLDVQHDVFRISRTECDGSVGIELVQQSECQIVEVVKRRLDIVWTSGDDKFVLSDML